MLKVVLMMMVVVVLPEAAYGQGSAGKPLRYPNNPGVHQDIVHLSVSRMPSSYMAEEFEEYAEWTPEILAAWDEDRGRPAEPESMYGNYALLEGAWEEDADYAGTSAFHHFWNPQLNFFSGLSGYFSAPERAHWLFKDAVAAYNRGEKYLAYYKLGRVAHLLADMSVPAHVNWDLHPFQDSYELLTGVIEKRDQDEELGGMAQFVDPDAELNILTYPGTPPFYDRRLANLFFTLADYAQRFDGDECNGSAANGFFRWYRIGTFFPTDFVDRVSLGDWVLTEGTDYLKLFEGHALHGVYLKGYIQADMANHNTSLTITYAGPLGDVNYGKDDIKTPKQVNDVMFPGVFKWDNTIYADELYDVYMPELLTRAVLATEALFEYFMECTLGTVTVRTAGPAAPIVVTPDVNKVSGGTASLELHYPHQVHPLNNPVPGPVRISVPLTWGKWTFLYWSGNGINVEQQLTSPTITVWPDGDLELTAHYTMDAPEGPAVEYLLGLDDDPQGLDYNGDGTVDVADVIAKLKQ